MKPTRAQLAERRVTRLAVRIRAGIAGIAIQVEADQRAGLTRETRWETWEAVIKDKVRDLVREARLTAKGTALAEEAACGTTNARLLQRA